MSITLTSVHDFRLDLRVPFFGLVSNVESSTVFIEPVTDHGLEYLDLCFRWFEFPKN